MDNQLPIRFQKIIDKDSNPPHWLWTGALVGPQKKAYARSVNGQTTTARRALWELIFGKLPDTSRVCRNCDVPLCIGPSCSKVSTVKSVGGSGRYTEEQNNMVLELLKDPNNSLSFIQRHTGVHRRTVWKIKQKLAESKE